jgi:hypothetical protein
MLIFFLNNNKSFFIFFFLISLKFSIIQKTEIDALFVDKKIEKNKDAWKIASDS